MGPRRVVRGEVGTNNKGLDSGGGRSGILRRAWVSGKGSIEWPIRGEQKKDASNSNRPYSIVEDGLTRSHDPLVKRGRLRLTKVFTECFAKIVGVELFVLFSL